MKFAQMTKMAVLLGGMAMATASMAADGAVTGLTTPGTGHVDFSGLVKAQACKIAVGGSATELTGNAALGTVDLQQHTIAEVTAGSTPVNFQLTFSECAYDSIQKVEVSDANTSADSMLGLAGGSTAQNVAVNVFNAASGGGSAIAFNNQVKQVLAHDSLAALDGSNTADIPMSAQMKKTSAGAVKSGTVKATMDITVTYN